jgi:hypothetical protein
MSLESVRAGQREQGRADRHEGVVSHSWLVSGEFSFQTEDPAGHFRDELLDDQLGIDRQLPSLPLARAHHSRRGKVFVRMRGGYVHDMPSTKPSIVVEPRADGRWARQKNGSRRAASLHATQAGAEEAARAQAKRERAELVVKSKDGRNQRRNSYGSDPRRTPG